MIEELPFTKFKRYPIPRDELNWIVDQAGKHLEEQDLKYVRETIAGEKLIARATFEVYEGHNLLCGCPLYSAGVVQDEEDATPEQEQFYEDFDRLTGEYLDDENAIVMEIVG